MTNSEDCDSKNEDIREMMMMMEVGNGGRGNSATSTSIDASILIIRSNSAVSDGVSFNLPFTSSVATLSLLVKNQYAI